MGSIYTSCYCRKNGIVNYMDLVDGVSLAETLDDATGIASKSVIRWRLK